MNLTIFLSGLAGTLVLIMSGGWLWQRKRQNAGIVDVLWTLGVGGSAVAAAICGSGNPAYRWTMAVLASAWSLRLALHLWHRVRTEAEDGRYRYLREHWHGHQGKFFLFFLFQAGLVVLFSLPFVAVATNTHAVQPLVLATAIAIWLIAVIGESAADRQLARFRADPNHRGKTCREGFWRHSRHPNYFFEWLHWFCYAVLAIGSSLWWLALLGPLTMYIFLRWLSGIPYTEAQALRSRGEDYRAYQRETPILIPCPWPYHKRS